MCNSYNNKDLEVGALVVLNEDIFAEEPFSFRHGEVGILTEFIPSRQNWPLPSVPPKAIVRMLGYNGYRTPAMTAWLTKIDVSACNGELIKYLQDLEDKKCTVNLFP